MKFDSRHNMVMDAWEAFWGYLFWGLILWASF